MTEIDWGDREPPELPEGIGPPRARFTSTRTDSLGPWVPCDLPGWERYNVLALVHVVQGRPCVTGIRVEPKSREDLPCLTQTRLRALPFAEIVEYATREIGLAEVEQQRAEMQAAAAKLIAEPEHPRAVTTPEQVAAIYNAANLSGGNPREAVVQALKVHERTAAKYIAKAREQGLLPPANRKGKNE